MPAWALALIALSLLLVPISPAASEELPTRASYVASVEPICRTNKAASDRYLTGVSALVKHDKLAKAAQNFSRAAAALDRAQKQLAAVPQPPEDAARLGRWLSGISSEAALMKTISTKLKAGDKRRASTLAVRLQHNATQTNNLVIAFQFNYCKIDPSKYT